jgi:hypothetical protein
MNSRQQHVIQALGQVTGSSDASARLRQQLGIPESVLQAANHNGIWDVTALLPYMLNVRV